MLSTTLLACALLVSPSLVSAEQVSGHQARPRQHRHRNLSRGLSRRAAADPSTISSGSLTTAEGCTKFYHVPKGEYCYLVAKRYELTLEDFYSMNPQIDNDCSNLWAGYDYCVARATSSASNPPTTTAEATTPPVKAAAVKVVKTTTKEEETTTKKEAPKTTTTVAPTTTEAPVPTTTTHIKVVAAAAVTKPAAVEEPEQEEEEEDCEEEDTTEESASTEESTDETEEDCEEGDEEEEETPAATPTVVAAAVQTTTAAAQNTQVASVSNIASYLSAAGISVFTGSNTNQILSWYRASYSGDDTNGHSWCYFPYKNTSPLVAIPVDKMIANAGGDAMAARKKFCGQEVAITYNGKVTKAFIGDGFDPAWVKTDAALDIMTDLFNDIYGSSVSDKNVVMRGSWEFTGNKSAKYSFNAEGDP